jgi:hypothetical protein|tara:strand:- start:1883 stop:2998 length:1116 start_codon:yes stop_codon:yes gene_type:complete
MSRLAHLLRRSPKNRYNKGQTINYPSTRKVGSLTNAITNFVNNNTNVLALPNRGTIVKDAVLAANPNIVTRKGTNITAKNVDKTLNKEYGKLDRGNISIANNPNAVALIEKMVSRQPSVKSTEIIEELTKIDPIYTNISNESVTKHINRSFPGLNRKKTSQEIRDYEAARHKQIAAWDDPIASAGIVNLRNTIAPQFTGILDDSQVLTGAHPAQIVNRVKPEGKTFITPSWRNSRHNKLENEAKRLMDEKNSIVSTLSPNDSASMSMLKDINKRITTVSDDMAKLGLESKLWNPSQNKFQYFGNLYGSGTNPYFNRSPVLSLRESILNPNIGKGPGFAQGGLVSLLKDKSLQRMAKNLIPKQFSILEGGLS